MENQNKLEVAEIDKGDFTDKDIQKIQLFMEEGLPGIARVNESKMAQIIDLYLSGKPYSQISTISTIPKSIILYMSHKFKWHSVKLEYLEDLEKNMMSRVVEAKVVNQDFMLQLMQFWQKRIGNNITKFLSTGNEEYANKVDLKDVSVYLKTVEMLQKLNSEPRVTGSQAPAVGLNLGEGVTITKSSNGSVEITPRQNKVSDLLKQFADQRREEERNSGNRST